MLITNEIIREDIENFNKRIRDAKTKLKDLPEGYLSYQEHKKREKKRHILESEIEHVKRLIHIAKEGLAA